MSVVRRRQIGHASQHQVEPVLKALVFSTILKVIQCYLKAIYWFKIATLRLPYALDDLRSQTDEYKALKEARDLEDVLFSG